MNKKGFTMLEMIFVLTVMVIILLLNIPNIQQKLSLVKNKGCEQLLNRINSEILAYELEKGYPPYNIDSLIKNGNITNEQKVCPNGKIIKIKNKEATVE